MHLGKKKRRGLLGEVAGVDTEVGLLQAIWEEAQLEHIWQGVPLGCPFLGHPCPLNETLPVLPPSRKERAGPHLAGRQ